MTDAISHFGEALHSGDRGSLDRTLASNASWISPAGHLWTKETALIGALARPVTVAPPKTFQYGNAAVALVVEKATNYESQSLDFWIHEQGGWRLAGRQSVLVHGKLADADKRPSVPAPPSSGAANERAAILRDLEVSNDAIKRRDATAWRALVTDGYISISAEGGMLTASQLAKEVTDGHMNVLTALEETSVRIYGESAIVTSKTHTAAEHGEVVPQRVTRIYVRQAGKWLRAAAIVTTVRDGD